MKNRTNPALWYVDCAVTPELHLLLFFLFYLSIIVLNKSHHGVHTFGSPYRPSASIGRYFLQRYIFRNGS